MAKKKVDKSEPKDIRKTFNIKQLQATLNRLQEQYFVATKAKKAELADKYASESNALIRLLKRHKFKVKSVDGKWVVSK